jgi:hypothetical protein
VLTDRVGRLSAAACGGGRRYLPLELLLRCDGRREQGIHDTGRRCGLGEVARLLRKGWPPGNGCRRGLLGGRTDRTAGMSCGLRGAGRCAAFIGRAQRRDARLQCRGTVTILTCVRTRPATDRWAHGGGTTRHAFPRDGLAFPGDRREGEPAARASRRWGLARTDAEAERAARGARMPGRSPALWRRSRARLIYFSTGQPYFDCVFLQKFEVCDKNGRYESCT